MKTLRIDLVKEKNIVLIHSKNPEPFEVLKREPKEKRVKGIWLLSGKVGYLPGETPTMEITDSWKESYLKHLRKNVKTLKKSIELLNGL